MAIDKRKYDATRIQLVEALQNTIHGASWDEFLNAYERLIFSVCLKHNLSETESEDVTQESIIKAYKQISNYDPKRGSFRNWLGLITKSCIYDFMRKKTRRPIGNIRNASNQESDLLEELEDPKNQFLEIWNSESNQYLIEIASERLKSTVKPRDYQVFHFINHKQWSTEKVAEYFDLSKDNVYQINSRVKKDLQGIILNLEKNLY